MKLLNIKRVILSIACGSITFVNAQTVLDADGSSNTYQLINRVLGGTAYEVPDCSHPAFGPHITQVWDDALSNYVFAFHIHVTPDDDRCINFDRQRTEIKTYESSPTNLLGYSGDVVEYKWMFKLSAGFQPSTSFTHIHQIKPVGGDEANPLFVLTPRKTSPANLLELGYYDNDNVLTRLKTAVLSDFLNEWVTVLERITVSPTTSGAYSITIIRNSDNKPLLSYASNNILTIRTTNSFIRPKWGIYRSLNNPSDLRDEIVYFAGFSLNKLQNTGLDKTAANSNKASVSPNPATSKATLHYSLMKDSNVTVSLHSSDGRISKTILDNDCQTSGEHCQPIDLMSLSNGVYLIQLVTNTGSSVIKLMLDRQNLD